MVKRTYQLDEPDEAELREIARHPITRRLAREFADCWRRDYGCEPFRTPPPRSWPVCHDPDPDKVNKQ